MVLNKEEQEMKDSDEKKTIDENEPDKKLLYLVRTLSRTKRKDYENYVVNAIWNRLNDDTLEIVTQQYIHNPTKPKKDQDGEKNHYFIDLYFPALKIGIECNEAFHKKQVEADEKRYKIIYGALHEIDNDEYESIPIDVTKTYQEVKEQIENAVKTIKQKKAEKEPLSEWKIKTAEEYYDGKNDISVKKDKVGFRTIAEACNILFSTDYKGMQHSCFSPETFKNSIYEGYYVWFPQLAIPDPNDNTKMISPTKAYWINELINNGEELIEGKDNEDILLEPAKKTIVFAKYKDLLGYNEYKFVGIFEYKEQDDEGRRHYFRKEDTCKIKQHIYK